MGNVTRENLEIAPDRLIAYEKNARTHSDAQVEQLVASIKEFGFTNPVLVDENYMLIAGHGRALAARKLGLASVPAVKLSGLTDAQKRALVLADNKLALNAGWDNDILAGELRDLGAMNFDLGLIGFSDTELDKLLRPTVFKAEPDAVPAAPAVAFCRPGDLWHLGKHRLFCGDCVLSTPYENEDIDLVFTDPPYNINYQGVKDKREKIANDKMSDQAFIDFIASSLPPAGATYVCCSWQNDHLFKAAMKQAGLDIKAMIVWDKEYPAQHLDLYAKIHEIIFYSGPFGGEKTARMDIWRVPRQRNTVHPTMKPVELIEMALADHPAARTVYDGFGGSGSTMIACEKQGKACLMVELEPIFCDVIIRRWQEFTGQVATHAVTGEAFNGKAAA